MTEFHANQLTLTTYRIGTSGRELYILPGIGTNPWDIYLNIPSKYADLLGITGVHFPTKSFRIANFVEDFIAQLPNRVVEPPIFVASSIGGVVAAAVIQVMQETSYGADLILIDAPRFIGDLRKGFWADILGKLHGMPALLNLFSWTLFAASRGYGVRQSLSAWSDRLNYLSKAGLFMLSGRTAFVQSARDRVVRAVAYEHWGSSVSNPIELIEIDSQHCGFRGDDAPENRRGLELALDYICNVKL